MKRRSKWMVYIIGCLLVLGGVGAIYLWSRAGSASAPPKTVSVKRGTLVEAASLSGKVQANVTVEVKSRASGEVIEVAVIVGQKVKAGDLLVKLDPVDERRAVSQAAVSLNSANAKLEQARASLAISKLQATEAAARREARRRARLTGNVTEEELRQAESEAAVAEGTVGLRESEILSATSLVQSAQLTLDDANRRLEQTTIVAPMAGVVLSVSVQRGYIVSSPISNVGGGSSLCVLGDLSLMHVLGALDEADMGRVNPQQEVEIRVDAYPQRVFSGKVALVSPLGRETSNVVTFDLDVVVTDKDAALLLPGMNADLQVVTSRVQNALIVPVSAVRLEGRELVVQTPQGELKPVKVGTTDGTSYVVLDGVVEGEEIVANNARAAQTASRGFSLFGGARR